jgi:DNA-binding MarR family transcriptional regulator
VIPADFAYGLASGLAVAAVLYVLLWWWTRRTTRSATLPDADPSPQKRPPPSEETAPLNSGGADRPAAPVAPPPWPPSPPDAGTSLSSGPARSADPPKSLPPKETLRLSHRVILHVYAQGTLAPGEVAPPGLCQAGMVEALGIPQTGLAAVLRRLEAAEVLTTERGHVRGHDRRLKIYRLSPRGLELARELRTRTHRASRR